MPQRLKAVAFDLDAASLISLREALPEWDIDLVSKATTGSLTSDWDPGTADLVVIAAGDRTADTLGLCRILRSQVGRAQVPLLVLVPPDRNALVEAVLEAGADSCLLLPVHAKEIVSMLNHLREGNRPGRHTLNLEQAQYKDRWRDEGGQG
jgi:DNA-binding response OmpR family regulator